MTHLGVYEEVLSEILTEPRGRLLPNKRNAEIKDERESFKTSSRS